MPISWVRMSHERAVQPNSYRKASANTAAGGAAAAALRMGDDHTSFALLKSVALRHHQNGDLARAIAGYKTLLKLRAEDAGLWSNLGAALRSQRKLQSAVNCYHRALAIRPGDLVALGNLANALKDQHRLAESLQVHTAVLRRAPEAVRARINYACALRESGQFVAALAQLDIAGALQPGDAGIDWERAQNLLYLGRYREGWPAYEARWRTGDLPPAVYPCPQWRGDALREKRILLHAEQGYGDTILAARFIPLLKALGAHVTLACRPELHRVLADVGADSLLSPSCQVRVSNHQAGHAPRTGEYDYHCPLMSVMGALNIQPDTLPPPARLAIPSASRQKFAWIGAQAPDSLRVGIVWSGSISFANNVNRAVDLARFLRLGEIPAVRLYSLQKGPPLRALVEADADCVIECLGGRCDDFADTAAAIEQLHVIVMTDSSVAHLAASMGKPVINLLQAVPYWIYALDRTTTPWYPAMRLLRQSEPGQWEGVFARAWDAVRALAQCRQQLPEHQG